MAGYEVELKFPLADRNGLSDRMAALGARHVGEVEQSDRYFAHPVRRFEETDEAFRLRSEGESNFLTYKGPLLDQSTKTRQEIELSVAPGPKGAHQAWVMLRALGFEDVFTVRKQRTLFTATWEGRPFSLALDRVEDLGEFLEIETLAGAGDWEAARDAAVRLGEALQLNQSERRSYLHLLIERHPSRSR